MLVQAVKKSFLSAVQCILVFLTVCHFTSNHTANWTDLKRVCSLAVLLVEECNKDKWAAVNTVTDRTGSEVNELWELLVILAIKNTEPREMIYRLYILRVTAHQHCCPHVPEWLVNLWLYCSDGAAGSNALIGKVADVRSSSTLWCFRLWPCTVRPQCKTLGKSTFSNLEEASRLFVSLCICVPCPPSLSQTSPEGL